ALGLAVWLSWPRKRASKEEALLALRHLQEDCASVYAQVEDAVLRAELPRDVLSASEGGDESEKLDQVLDQPLVLGGALRAAAERAAQELPKGVAESAEDLEAVFENFSEEPEFQEAIAELGAMHKACLQSGSLLPEASGQGPVDEATDDQLLETLRALGHARAE
ncbi:unnamed protein product, partial [Polarella glacialis]